jgi:hypothetical protein
VVIKKTAEETCHWTVNLLGEMAARHVTGAPLHVKLDMKIPVSREPDFSDYFLPPQSLQTHLPFLNLMATPVRSRRSVVIWLLRMIGYTSISVAVVTLVISWFRQFRKRIPRDDGRENNNGTSLRRRSSEMNGIDVIIF